MILRLVSPLALLGLLGCSPGTEGPAVDSRTHWLESCDDDSECGTDSACLCGICSIACQADIDCEGPRPAQCQDPSQYAECPRTLPSEGPMCVQTCEESSTCDDAQICVGGICVREVEPESDLCPQTWDETAEEFEMAVIAEINERRAAGGECEGMSIEPQIGLRLDYDLRCAARLHSEAMRDGDFVSGDLPDGSTVRENAVAVSYGADSFNYIVVGAEDLPEVTTQLDSRCDTVLDDGKQDVAVGRLDRYVTVLLGRE